MEKIKITDIAGIKIGNAQSVLGGTGCTVIICEEGAIAGVDVRGGGPASHETELLNPVNTVERIHSVVLSGGSAFGLEATSGVMRYLENKKIGFQIGDVVVPIVCGASLFDLLVGDSRIKPDREMGYEACCNAQKNIIEEGNVGAGTGATVGKWLGKERAMKSGLGVYAVQVGDLKIGAIVAVNAIGDVFDIETNEVIAGILDEQGEKILSTEKMMLESLESMADKKNSGIENTTIGCIITNAKLTKAQMNKVASMAHNGYARTIRPVHTSLDGDTIFAMTTAKVEASMDIVGTLGAFVMGKAINRAVQKATTAYGYVASCDKLN